MCPSVIMFLLRLVALKAHMILSCSEKSTDKLEQLCQVNLRKSIETLMGKARWYIV